MEAGGRNVLQCYAGWKRGSDLGSWHFSTGLGMRASQMTAGGSSLGMQVALVKVGN